MRFSFRSKLFLSHLAAVFLVSGSIGTFFYFSAASSLKTSLQARLQNSAAFISEALDAAQLRAIQSEADTQSAAYQENLRLLRKLRETNPDIAFLYVMRKEAGQIKFVLDSDESHAQALPGRLYTNTLPSMEAGFTAASVDPEMYQDDWGVFMSGYAPLRNGQGEYLVGLDMRADEVHAKFRHLRWSGIFSLACSVLLALFFSRVLSRPFSTQIQRLIARCSALAAGRFGEQIQERTGDDLDRLVEAFNRMSADLAAAHDARRRQEDELRHAKDDLEIRVAQRTKDLHEANQNLMQEIVEHKQAEIQREKAIAELQTALERVKILSGLLPICASCKKVRDDQGYWKQVEEFMEEHTTARFSHSICPDCYQRLYPGMDV